MRIEKTSSEIIIHCGSHVDLSSVVDLKAILLRTLQTKKPICLDASEISKIDTAGIQLFLNFILAASKANISWHWQNPTPPVINMSELLGVDEVLAIKHRRGD